MTKKIILPSMLALAVLTVVVLGTQTVSAKDSAGYPTIVERLASKFNLDKDAVQDVFTEVSDERRADMFANWAERLDDLVAEGKMTDAQKQTILDKHEEMQAKMESLRNLAPEERRAKMREYNEEFRKWAKDQGIDFPLMAFKFGFHKGFKAGYFNQKLN